MIFPPLSSLKIGPGFNARSVGVLYILDFIHYYILLTTLFSATYMQKNADEIKFACKDTTKK